MQALARFHTSDSNSFAVARLIATGPATRAGARFARVEPPLAYELDGELG